MSGTDGRPPGIDELLEQVREGYRRFGPEDAHRAARAGEALLVDIRYAALRERDGLIPGALVIERNELEWRLDPQGSHRVPEASGHDVRVVVICNEGYASSLAAASLHRLGLSRATDLVGGFQAWRAAGLPVAPAAAGSPPGIAPADGDQRFSAPQSSSPPRNSMSSPSSSSASRTTRRARPSE